MHAGDHIWWDLHDWSATENIPAVVGSFPEPFTNGIGGKRYPVTLECASDVDAACKQVTKAHDGGARPRLQPAAGHRLRSGTRWASSSGTWSAIRSEVAAELVAHGPGASGVYARFSGPEGDSAAAAGPERPGGAHARRRAPA